MGFPAFRETSVPIAHDTSSLDRRVEQHFVEKIEKDMETKGVSQAILVLAIDSAPTAKNG